MITTDQVTALAPDAKSFKAGKALATVMQWPLLGRDAQTLWGEVLGSGKNPYQTQVILGGFATKCSCPSRKFPCKHALALMFLAADDLSRLPEAEPPDWVKAWRASRTERAEKASAKKKASKKGPKDGVAAAKRVARREARVEEGLDILETYLLDLIRDGLTQERATDPASWEALGKRLVDCQAPGLAGYVRRLGELPHQETDWEHRMVHELGALHLLIETYRKRTKLSPDLRAEVEQQVGWPVDQDAVRASAPVTDTWFVAQRTLREVERLLTSSTWLYGRETGRWALLLNFAALPARPMDPWPIGSEVRTSLTFFPGLAPDRALAVDAQSATTLAASIPDPGESIEGMLERASRTLAINPWRTRHPFLLAGHPAEHAGKPVILDGSGHALPWKARGEDTTFLRSVCGGRPVMLAGEWDGYHLHLHAAADGLSWFSLRTHAA